MCDKLPYCARNVDPCIKEDVEALNELYNGKFKTLSSCCGHGRYHATIVVQNTRSKSVFEWYSGVSLTSVYFNGKPRKRFYKKDGRRKGDHYFVPEAIES